MDRTEEATGTQDAPPVELRGAVLTRVLRRDDLRVAGSSHALLGVRRVLIGRGATAWIRQLLDGQPGLALQVDDRRISSRHAALRWQNRAWVLRDLGSTNGTRINGQPLATDEAHTLKDGDHIEIGQSSFVLRLDQPIDPRAALDLDAEAAEVLPTWRSFHRPLRAVYARARMLAPSAQSLLILGPTGSGKERLAQGVHAASGRSGAFVACNCATLPAGLVESTLFGHAAGAFTGAAQARQGLFRAAHHGTLFLDEVGALAADAQAKLLRVLETGVVRPVGQDRAVSVDVRVVAATLAPLDAEAFRPDLQMRLAQSSLTLPSLVERREDLGLMLSEHLHGLPIQFDAAACAAFFRHDWPGNMRELANVMGELRVIAGWRSPRIGPRDLPAWAQRAAPPADAERARLDDALRRHKGNVKAAAAWLGLSRQQTYVLIRRHGVDPNRFR